MTAELKALSSPYDPCENSSSPAAPRESLTASFSGIIIIFRVVGSFDPVVSGRIKTSSHLPVSFEHKQKTHGCYLFFKMTHLHHFHSVKLIKAVGFPCTPSVTEQRCLCLYRRHEFSIPLHIYTGALHTSKCTFPTENAYFPISVKKITAFQ